MGPQKCNEIVAPDNVRHFHRARISEARKHRPVLYAHSVVHACSMRQQQLDKPLVSEQDCAVERAVPFATRIHIGASVNE